jgi:hypothetical protein
MKTPRWIWALALLLSSCTNTTFTGDPPENLEIQARFIDVDAPSDGKIAVAVQFFQKGKFVDLTSGATIRCNGTELVHTQLGYSGRVPAVPAAGTYEVAHELGGERTSLKVTAPARPVITQPAAGAQLSRTAEQVIQFTAGGGGAVQAMAIGPAGSEMGAPTQALSGVTKVTASTVGAGNGSLVLTREIEGGVDGTGFAAASYVYSVDKRLPVVWQ